MILNFAKDSIIKVINLGISDDLNNYNKIRLRVFNAYLNITLLFQLLLLTVAILSHRWIGMKIMLVQIFLFIGLIFLQSKNKIKLNTFLYNLCYPTIIFGLVFMYVQPNNIGYIFLAFIISSLLIQEKIWEKILLVIVNAVYYIFTQCESPYIGYYGEKMTDFNNFMLVFMAVGSTIAALHILLHELNTYEKNNKKLIIELENKNKKLSAVNEELERFTSGVSHDMKTPIRAINSFVTVIERKIKGEDEELLRYFDYVKKNTNQLHQLIVDSLNYAKIGQEEMILENVSLNEILFDLIRDFSADNVEIYTETFPDVLSNKTLVRKLFQNIIENGIKYNVSDLKIIEITHKKLNENIIFEIKDNGIGIDKVFHEQIFEMYKQLNNKNEYQGTGLGLSICKKIAVQLKGDIWVDSEVGKGSSFLIQLPTIQTTTTTEIIDKKTKLMIFKNH